MPDRSGTTGHSTTAVLNDGAVGDLYEIGSTGGIVFADFTLNWVEGA
ncbi:hypothetical protein [Kitasatospora paranensis]|uniref:Uncharacterized protein n=1 Tax=Kitasatospora paranensis TaxID=258053 RepID=A0ABW2G4V1_9ACTN